MTSLETMKLGQEGPEISRLGMGCWAIGGHGWGTVRDEDSILAVTSALDQGVTFFDTADAYGLGKSETLLADVLGASRTNVVIASKGGVRWNDSGQVWTDTSPAYLRTALENSLKRLKLDCIPLYYIHKPDMVTPVEESIAALEDMRKEGKIGTIGVSNFSADQLARVLRIAPIAAVQVRFNIFDHSASRDLWAICKREGITLVAWGALADGLLTGKFKDNTGFPVDDHRSRMSQLNSENLPRYTRCVDMLESIAAQKGRSVAQLALRWVLDYESLTCALFGARTEAQVSQNLGADGWSLTQSDLMEIESIVGELKR